MVTTPLLRLHQEGRREPRLAVPLSSSHHELHVVAQRCSAARCKTAPELHSGITNATPQLFPNMCAVSQFTSIGQFRSSIPDRFLFLNIVALEICTETPSSTKRADHPLDRRFSALDAEVPLTLWMSRSSRYKMVVSSGCTAIHSSSTVARCNLMLLTMSGVLEAEAGYQIPQSKISEDKLGALRFSPGRH